MAKVKGAASCPPNVVVKAPLVKAGPPPKASCARASSARATPRPQQSITELYNAISNVSGLIPKDAKSLLEALRDVVIQELREKNVFMLHGIMIIRTKDISARAAHSINMFGKAVVLPAKPARKKITCIAIKPLYDALSADEVK